MKRVIGGELSRVGQGIHDRPGQKAMYPSTTGGLRAFLRGARSCRTATWICQHSPLKAPEAEGLALESRFLSVASTATHIPIAGPYNTVMVYIRGGETDMVPVPWGIGTGLNSPRTTRANINTTSVNTDTDATWGRLERSIQRPVRLTKYR